jgi:hypothetical protein
MAHKEKLPVPNISESWNLEDNAEMDADDMYHDTQLSTAKFRKSHLIN